MANKRIKIFFILPHLKSGGAERVVSFIFSKLDKNKFDPFLIVIGFEKDNVYKIKGTNIIYLNKKRLRDAILNIAFIIISKKPDIVFSSIGHINLYLGLLKNIFPKIRFIAREASIYSIMKTFSKHSSPPHFILNFLYGSLDLIIFQSLEMKIDFIKTFRIKPNNTCIINNPITFHNRLDLYNLKNPLLPYKLITVGSLVENKGHSRILNILKSVDFNFKLNIVGEGPLRSDLELKVKQLNLSNAIFFQGLQKDLSKFYKNSDFLIQGSFVEGFPNVVLEALSFGIPCLIFEAPGGHNELIIEGFNGFIIRESDNYIDTLNKFVGFKWDRKSIQDDAYKRFNSKKIVNIYETLFIKIAN